MTITTAYFCIYSLLLTNFLVKSLKVVQHLVLAATCRTNYLWSSIQFSSLLLLLLQDWQSWFSTAKGTRNQFTHVHSIFFSWFFIYFGYYFQGSFDLVKSFVTRRNEHGGFLVNISFELRMSSISVLLSLLSMLFSVDLCLVSQVISHPSWFGVI